VSKTALYSSYNRLKAAFLPSKIESHCSWSNVGTALLQSAQSWYHARDQRALEATSFQRDERALSLALYYVDNVAAIARKSISLLEKLNLISETRASKVSGSASKRKRDDEGADAKNGPV
jgi:hypothetical protein